MPDPTTAPTRGAAPEAAAADDELEALLRELRLVVAGDESLGRALHRIAAQAAESVDGVDEVSVTVQRNRAAVTAAFSGPAAAALDERQYASGTGPCLQAASSGEPVLLPSLEAGAAGRFEDFARGARRVGVRSVVALPLQAGQRVRGALNAYTSGEVPLSAAGLARLEAFAVTAGAALAAAVTYAAALEEAANTRAMMESRAVIEQAKGVLMARLAVDAEAAFDELRRTSQHANRKLRDVAADVVASAAPARQPSPGG